MISPALAVAMYSATTAYASMLANMSPEQRSAYLERQRARREAERTDAAPEVVLARETIANDGLQGEHAERLLEFARELARRRQQ